MIAIPEENGMALYESKVVFGHKYRALRSLAHESQMEACRRNALRERDETATAQVLTESVGLLACIDRAKELSRWEERKRADARDWGFLQSCRGVKAGAYMRLMAPSPWQWEIRKWDKAQ